ncbi:MAG: 4Fe-4S dicluster domain-containing protein [Thermodesulfobacteriota bacterium]
MPAPLFLRPPGARPEREFLARCLHCGQCAQVCPYKSIRLTTGTDPLTAGTPRILPRAIPCYLCMRCPPACPSGALAPLDIKDVRMGLAEIDRDACLPWSSQIVCRSCFEACPLKGRAIDFKDGMFPVVTALCAGCGLCEHVCPVKAVTTLPERMRPARRGA